LLLKSSSKGWAAIYRFQKHLLYSIHSFSHGGRFSKLNRLVVVCTASPVHCFSCALLLLISACLVTPTPVHCFSSYQLASSPPRQCTASPHISLPRHPHASALLLLISACLVTPTPVHCFSSYQFTSSSPRQQLQITTILIYPLKKFLTCVEIERSSPSALCRAGQGCSYVLQVCLAGMGG
jgi:hypothetical protein